MARMGNTSVNLTMRVASRYYPVVMSRNGRIKPGWICIADRQEHHLGSVYYLDWYAGGKRKRKAVGRDAMHAQNMARQKELERKSALPEVLVAPIDPTLPARLLRATLRRSVQPRNPKRPRRMRSRWSISTSTARSPILRMWSALTYSRTQVA
jgi:hypothetical protein